MVKTFTYEDISVFLPRYLADDEDFKRQIVSFTKGEVSRTFYSRRHWNDEVIYQGDGLKELPVINLPEPEVTLAKGIVLSNTCDVALENKRYFPGALVYAPVFSLQKYLKGLREEGVSEKAIADHADAIRRQYITQVFYLPDYGAGEEAVVFFDRVCNCDNESIDRQTLTDRRLFMLSNFGFYLFLFKLSIHFTRIKDGVDRGPAEDLH